MNEYRITADRNKERLRNSGSITTEEAERVEVHETLECFEEAAGNIKAYKLDDEDLKKFYTTLRYALMHAESEMRKREL